MLIKKQNKTKKQLFIAWRRAEEPHVALELKVAKPWSMVSTQASQKWFRDMYYLCFLTIVDYK